MAGVSKVSALKRTTEVVKHREGGDPSSRRKSPGRTEFEAITLERGVTHDVEFEKWANKVWNFGAGLGAEMSLKDFRKDLIIELYNEAGQLVIAYRVFRCWVSEFQAQADLDANANAVLIQTHQARKRRLGARHRRRGTERADVGVTFVMRPTPARQLLDGWEALRGQPMAVRAAALAALLTGRPLEAVMRWSIGRRDRALFDFRAQMFGDRVEAVTPCPDCAEPLEMQLALAEIAPPKKAAPKSEFRALRVDGARVRCREPNSEDLLAIASSSSVAEARAQLVARCIRDRRSGTAGTRGRAPDAPVDRRRAVEPDLSGLRAWLAGAVRHRHVRVG